MLLALALLAITNSQAYAIGRLVGGMIGPLLFIWLLWQAWKTRIGRAAILGLVVLWFGSILFISVLLVIDPAAVAAMRARR